MSAMNGQDAHQVFEVRDAGPKGLGVFATSHIPRGTRVIEASSLLEHTQQDEDLAIDAFKIVRIFENLPTSEQDEYYELHRYMPESHRRDLEQAYRRRSRNLSTYDDKILAIRYVNGFPQGVFKGPASRLNHSCVPNIRYGYNPATKKMTFHATRDIAPQEELTITYLGGEPYNLRNERQRMLDDLGFQCTCPACARTEDGEKQERLRDTMTRHKNMVTALLESERWKCAVEEGLELAKLLESEGFVGSALIHSCHDIARASVKMGDARGAVFWARKQPEVQRLCIGDDHVESRKLDDIVESLYFTVEHRVPLEQLVLAWTKGCYI